MIPTLDTSSPLQLLDWLLKPYPFMEECRRKMGDMFRIHIPGLGFVVVVAHPEGVKEIFAQSGEAAHAGKANVVLKPFLGEHSLLLLDGAPHARHRKMMMPAFHGERMQAYGRAMLSLTDQAIDHFPLGKPFAIHGEMQAITLQVILRTVFGVASGPRFVELANLLTEVLDVLAWPGLLFPFLQVDLGPWSPWGKVTRMGARVKALLHEEIDRGRREGTAGREDVLAMMLQARDEAGAPLSNEEIHDELITLLIAGHETTATALSWALGWLLPNPRLVERLQAEVGSLASDGPLDPGKIARSELLDGVAREALRLAPVIPLVGRVMQQPIEIMGHTLPVNTRLAPSIYLIHHRPDLYPNSKTFDPDRYRTFKPAPWEFLPFGGGIRRCIGAAFAMYELKVVLAALFARLTLRLAPGYHPMPSRRAITITPSDGLPVVVTSRAPARGLG